MAVGRSSAKERTKEGSSSSSLPLSASCLVVLLPQPISRQSHKRITPRIVSSFLGRP